MDITPGRTWGSVVGDHLRDRTHVSAYLETYSRLFPCGRSSGQRASEAFPDYLWSCTILENTFERKHLCAGQFEAGLDLLYWALTREEYTKSMQSYLLQLAFYFVEDAPVLSILEDFLPRLDIFFQNHKDLLSHYLQTGDESSESVSERALNDAKCLKENLSQGMAKGTSVGFGPVVSDLDEKYVEALEMYCLLKMRLLDVRHSWRTVVQKALCDHGKHKSFSDSHYSGIVSTLESLVLLAQGVLQCLSSQDEQRPKFVQLCHQLNLTEKEEEALRFIFVHNVGVLFSKLHNRFSVSVSKSSLESSRQSSMALSAAAFAQMTSREMLEFLDRDRPHLKQELLEPEDEFSSLQTTSFIVMPTSVLKACCGCTLSAEDRFKIDKTAMGEIMSKGIKGTAASSDMLEESRDVSKKIEREEERMASEDETKVELEEILRTCNEANLTEVESDIPSGTEGQIQPYTTDLEYLEDNFQLIETLGKALKIEDEDDMLFRQDQRKPEAVIREMRAKSRSLKAKISQKMEATRKLEGWLPRLERLAELRKLDQFEKNILLLLIGSMVSKNLRKTGNSGASVFGHSLSIGAIISLFCEGLKEQIESRMYFYKNSILVSEGLVHVSDPPLHTRGNFLDSVVELDRRLLDYIVGLDTEINELVDGSDLYTPTVSLSDVALPQDHKQLLHDTFQSFDQFQKTCKEVGLSTKGTSKGLCLLFYGPSGTGKTMTANAVANFLKKKVLLISLSLIIEKDLTKELLKFLFREAKIHNAVLFFDECECLFESRNSRPNPTLGVLLTEIEQYSGVIILATNRHQDLDEAMHRRIQLALPFSVPDYTLREEIWKSHVPGLIASEDINWKNLALSHELTGGLICNAVLSALSMALKECSGRGAEEQPLLTEVLLTQGAKLQLRGLLEMIDFERRIIPTFGVRDLILEEEIKQQLNLVLNAGKTHKLISSQWGFGGPENVARGSGISVLICGPPGAGKTAIARAIAYELGQPIKEASCTELLSHTVSMQIRTARGIAPFFREAERTNAIIVLDGSEIMLSNLSSSIMTGVVGCEHLTLVHQVEHFAGVIILTSRQALGQLDLNRLPQLKYVLDISSPSTKLREELWRKLLPKRAPVSSDIDYLQLAERFSFNGGEIASCICHAAELCASATPQLLSHHALQAAAEFHMKRNQQRNVIPSLYS